MFSVNVFSLYNEVFGLFFVQFMPDCGSVNMPSGWLFEVIVPSYLMLEGLVLLWIFWFFGACEYGFLRALVALL